MQYKPLPPFLQYAYRSIAAPIAPSLAKNFFLSNFSAFKNHCQALLRPIHQPIESVMSIIKTLIYDKKSDLSSDPSGQAVKNIVQACQEAFTQFRDNPG